VGMEITDPDDGDDSDLADLKLLHPDYTDLELKESRAQLYQYFDLAWEVFTRLEREGKLEEVMRQIREKEESDKNDSHETP
jgi:hypothetical protein